MFYKNYNNKMSIEKDLADTLSLIEKHDTDYDIRYQLVLKAMYLSASLGYVTGIRMDDDAEDEHNKWWVAFIILPNGIGEISWHNPTIKSVFSGYDVTEKYLRCAKYMDFVNK